MDTLLTSRARRVAVQRSRAHPHRPVPRRVPQAGQGIVLPQKKYDLTRPPSPTPSAPPLARYLDREIYGGWKWSAPSNSASLYSCMVYVQYGLYGAAAPPTSVVCAPATAVLRSKALLYSVQKETHSEPCSKSMAKSRGPPRVRSHQPW